MVQASGSLSWVRREYSEDLPEDVAVALDLAFLEERVEALEVVGDFVDDADLRVLGLLVGLGFGRDVVCGEVDEFDGRRCVHHASIARPKSGAHALETTRESPLPIDRRPRVDWRPSSGVKT